MANQPHGNLPPARTLRVTMVVNATAAIRRNAPPATSSGVIDRETWQPLWRASKNGGQGPTTSARAAKRTGPGTRELCGEKEHGATSGVAIGPER